MAKKKSYNPFKMLGSWIGGVVLSSIFWYSWIIESISIKSSVGFILILFGLGFLVGWGIHSLIRRLKK